jgi:hypothetical protein
MRAEKMRTLAEDAIDSTVRAMMVGIAADYDRLAESADNRAAHDSIMFRTAAIGGGRRGHAMRSRRRPDRLLQENDEQSGVYGRGAEGNNRVDGSQTMRVNAR